MSQRKGKKRPHSRGADPKRPAGQLSGGPDKKRLDPTARLLLYGDLVFLAVASLLYANQLISELVSGLCTAAGTVLLLLALWLQFGPRDRGGGLRR